MLVDSAFHLTVCWVTKLLLYVVNCIYHLEKISLRFALVFKEFRDRSKPTLSQCAYIELCELWTRSFESEGGNIKPINDLHFEQELLKSYLQVQ